MNDWRTANIHKVVVVCLQRDQETNRRIASRIVPILRRQGFEAMAGQDIFSAASAYSHWESAESGNFLFRKELAVEPV